MTLVLGPKAKWKRVDVPFAGRWYAWGDCRAGVSLDDGLWHLSISCKSRYPTWDEIHAAWYDLVPGAEDGGITGAILLPPKTQYVNMHEFCMHVYQLDDSEVRDDNNTLRA